MNSILDNIRFFGFVNSADSKEPLDHINSLKKEAPLSLSYTDAFLCASNIISLTSNFLINQGFDGLIPLAFRDISILGMLLGESFLSENSLNVGVSVLPGIALTVARVFALSMMKSNPYMKPIVLAMNIYGTCSVVQKALIELQKCFQVYKEDPENKHSGLIVRNVFVHGINSSCSVYNLASFFSECLEDLLPRSSPSFRNNNPFKRDDSIRPISKKIPIITSGQISDQIVIQEAATPKITMISASDNGIKQYADLVAPNQKAFAEQKGYGYVRYSGNLTKDRAPYWSKIVAIWDQLQKIPEGHWIAWVDASAIVTNTSSSFEQVISNYGEGKDLILTNDPQIPINNAVFLIKNTAWAKDFIQRVWSRTDLAVGGQGNCGTRYFPHCHYEQQSMTELWEQSRDVQKHTSVISNKLMNSFYRYSHFDSYRKMHLNYNDPIDSKWTDGDFICKVTGMDKDRRLKMIQYVLLNCVNRKCHVPTSDSGFSS